MWRTGNGRLGSPIATLPKQIALRQAYGAPVLAGRPDDEWRALTREAGWEFPNPFGEDEATVRAATRRLHKEVTWALITSGFLGANSICSIFGPNALATSGEKAGRLTLDNRGDPCGLRRTHGRGRLFEIDWLRARPKLGGRRRRGLRLRSRGSRFGRGRDKAAGDGAGCAACLAKS